ncbi:MAG: PAS domain S-box protein [Halobacteriaceae archaeon]
MGDGNLPGKEIQAAVDRLPANIAIINGKGEIIYTNEAWENYCLNDGIQEQTATIGTNYLEKTRQGDDEFSAQAEHGLRDVIGGARDTFELDYPCHSADEKRWFRMHAAGFESDTQRYAVIEHTEITDRIIGEQEAARFRKAVEQAGHAVYITDSEGEIRYVNPSFERITGYSADEVLGDTPRVLKSDEMSDDYYRELWNSITAGETCQEVIPHRRKSGEIFWVNQTIAPISEGGEIAYYIVVQQEITERKIRREALATAQEAGTKFLRAGSIDELADIFARASGDISGAAYVSYFHYNQDSNSFEALSSVGEFDHERAVPVSPSESLLGEAWLNDKVVHTTNGVFPDAEENDVKFRLAEPVGDFGVLLRGFVSTPRSSEVEEILNLVIQGMEAAVENTTLDARIRKQKSQLDAATNQIDQLLEVNEEIRRISNQLLGIGNERDVAKFVSRRLSAIDPFSGVWFGEYNWEVGTLQPVTARGEFGGYLDSISLATSDSTETSEPSLRSITERESVVVNSIADDLRESTWREQALSNGFASVVSVPIENEGRLYGVLSIYGEQPIDFPDQTLAALIDLGETVGHAIHRIRQQEALLSPKQLELGFAISSTKTPLGRLGEALETRYSVSPYDPKGADEVGFLCEVEDLGSSEFEAARNDVGDVLDCQILSDDDSSLVFLAQPDRKNIPNHIAELGGELREMIVDAPKCHVRADFPKTANVRAISDALSRHFPSVELSSRQVRTEPTATMTTDSQTSLTERQREVLELAMKEGYFEWPRDVSAEELADSLGIDSSTLHRHLRVGLRKVLEENSRLE